MRVLRHKQVFQDGQVLEQPHVLEGTHQAMLRHLVAGHAGNRAAIHDDIAGGGFVEPAHAIEYRCLAGPVGADNGKDFVAMYIECNLIYRQQTAKPHRQARYLKQYFAHTFNSTCGRLTGSKPCGRHIIIKTITKPKISIRYSANSRAISGTTVSTMAARITPTCEPIPPSTTMARIRADSMNVKDSGLTRPWRAAKNTPPKPANMAPMVKAESLMRVGFSPRERQAISSSRRASQARPIGMRITRFETNKVIRARHNAIR